VHPFFDPLSNEETMLLLVTLTVGGQEATALFRYLPNERAMRLMEKAGALLEIPAGKRIPLMVQQMKQGLKFKGLRGAERVDPSWLVRALYGEQPRTVGAILVSMPPNVQRAVLQRLPDGIRKHLPPKHDLQRVPVELVRSVRQIFESRFDAMPQSNSGEFGFHDILQLDREDLAVLIREVGLVELGQAFAAVGKLALAEFCRRLPRGRAEELITAVRHASEVDAPDIKTAQRFLARVVGNFRDTEEFFQNAGLWRLAKASLHEDPVFHAAFRQRVPAEAGERFDSYLEKAADMEALTPDIAARLQDASLLRLKLLSERGAISLRWSQLELKLSRSQE
jgi:hypothetical protein